MVTINNNNVQEYIDKLLIDPYKIKIDLNTSKTTSDNVHRWITLADAIKGGYKFSFDYDLKDKPTEVSTLPEVVVTPLPRMYSVGAGEMKPFNSAAEAAKYAQEHPKKDASEVDTNCLLLGGLGLSRPLGGILLNGVKETLPYFSANGWLLSTLTVGNTPAWLTPKVATAIDAGLAGSATGASMYDWYLNGPSVENVLGTTLGVGGLTFEAAPIAIDLYQGGKKAYNTYLLSRAISKAPFTPAYNIYSKNPMLLSLGSAQLYIDYVNSIYPESKFTNIVYHGGRSGITKFKAPKTVGYEPSDYGTADYGIYFAKDPKLANLYRIWANKNSNEGAVYPVKVNLKTPIRYDHYIPFLDSWSTWNKSRFTPDAISLQWYSKLGLNKYDGIILNKSLSGTTRGSVIVFDPENIHILGNSNDILGFKNFMKSPYIPTIKESYPIDNMPNLWDLSLKNILSDINNNKFKIGTSITGIGSGLTFFYALGNILKNKSKIKDIYNNPNKTEEDISKLLDYYGLNDPMLSEEDRLYLINQAKDDGLDLSTFLIKK